MTDMRSDRPSSHKIENSLGFEMSRDTGNIQDVETSVPDLDARNVAWALPLGCPCDCLQCLKDPLGPRNPA